MIAPCAKPTSAVASGVTPNWRCASRTNSTSAGIDDATLIEFGQAVCTGFDSGATFAELAAMGLDTTLNNIDLGYTMGVAVGAYCPEYSDQIG